MAAAAGVLVLLAALRPRSIWSALLRADGGTCGAVLVAARAGAAVRGAGGRALLARDLGSGARGGAGEAARRRRAGRRYIELVTENLGQPGFRELVLAVHDLDAPRSGIRAGERRAAARRWSRRAATAEARGQRGRRSSICRAWRAIICADVVAAAMTVPVVSEPHPIQYAAGQLLAWRDAPAVRSPGCLIRLR